MQENQELPQGWELVTIEQLCEICSGQTPNGITEVNGKGAYSWFRVGDMNTTGNEKFLKTSSVNLTEEQVKKFGIKLRPAGTIVFPKRGGAIATNKKRLLANSASFDLNSMGLIPRVGAEYFWHWFASIDLGSLSDGSNVPQINNGDILPLKVPLPPLPEQRRIVAKLEELFSRWEAGVAALRQTQAQIKRYRQAVLHAAVTGELTRAWREAHPTPTESGTALLARIRQERRAQWEAAQLAKRGGQLSIGDAWKKKYEEPATLNTSELPELPGCWIWASVEQLAAVGTGATPLRGNQSYYTGGTIPWVTSGALNNLFITKSEQFITELAVEETNAKVFPLGTLLVAMYGEGKTRGKVSELQLPAATNQACAAIIFDSSATDKIKPIVKLFFQKNYDDLRRLSSGGVQPNLNLSIIKATAVPLPPLAEQTEIVAEVERRLSVLDELEHTLRAELTRTERLRQSILHRAFTGRLVPQDPTDEPAAALLARLQAEVPAGAATKAKRGRKAGAQIDMTF